jgi:hypothetical protein
MWTDPFGGGQAQLWSFSIAGGGAASADRVRRIIVTRSRAARGASMRLESSIRPGTVRVTPAARRWGD